MPLCWCLCHRNSTTTVGPVETDDVIEAAVACDRCRRRHCAALLSKQLPSDPDPVVREVVEWVDLPPTNADGEGVE